MDTSVKILIVDDSEIVVERLSAIVSEMNCQKPVLISNTFQQAVSLIIQEEPQIVLLDIRLSNESGIDLLRYIRQHYPAIKTIVVSNRASSYYRKLCMDSGANGFIDKSTEFENIPPMIQSFFPAAMATHYPN